MTSIIVAFLVSLAVATILTPCVLKVALARGLYDVPNERKVHARLIPRLGGVAIVIAFFAPVTGLLLVDAGLTVWLTANEAQLWGLYVGGLAIALLGLYDDLVGAGAKLKFVAQIAVACVMWAFHYRIAIVSSPLGGTIELGIFALPVTILWFVGVMNAVNLIDGLDGLASGIGLISVTTLMVLALAGGNMLAALMCACLAGALVGFLFFNFNPARIFMGDTGSLFLGFVLAAFSISTSAKGSTAIAIAVPILVLGLPLADTLLAVLRRLREHRPVFSPDQEHIHHRLLKAGFTHRGAVLMLYAVAGLLAGFALLIRFVSEPIAALVLIVAGIVLFTLLRLLITWRRPAGGLHDPFGEDGLRIRGQIDAVSQRIQAAQTAEVLVSELNPLVQLTGCHRVVITDGDRVLFAQQAHVTPGEATGTRGRYVLPLAQTGSGRKVEISLSFYRRDAEHELGIILAWERLRSALAEVLERLSWPVLQAPLPPLSEPDGDEGAILPLPELPPWTRRLPRAKAPRVR